jgi:hypothetical protein
MGANDHQKAPGMVSGTVLLNIFRAKNSRLFSFNSLGRGAFRPLAFPLLKPVSPEFVIRPEEPFDRKSV